MIFMLCIEGVVLPYQGSANYKSYTSVRNIVRGKQERCIFNNPPGAHLKPANATTISETNPLMINKKTYDIRSHRPDWQTGAAASSNIDATMNMHVVWSQGRASSSIVKIWCNKESNNSWESPPHVWGCSVPNSYSGNTCDSLYYIVDTRERHELYQQPGGLTPIVAVRVKLLIVNRLWMSSYLDNAPHRSKNFGLLEENAVMPRACSPVSSSCDPIDLSHTKRQIACSTLRRRVQSAWPGGVVNGTSLHPDAHSWLLS